MLRSVKFSENTKPEAAGISKNNITNENVNRLNKQSVNITEKMEPIAILNKAREDTVAKMVEEDPRFENDDELSEMIYKRLRIQSRYICNKYKSKLRGRTLEMIPPNYMQLFISAVVKEISMLKYDVLKKQIEDAAKLNVGQKRPHWAIGGTRRKRRRHTSLKRK